MKNIYLGLLFGLAFGILDTLLMIPLTFENKRKRVEAMTGAFLERFLLGFLIPNVSLPLHPVWTGFLMGLGLSVPTAIITRAYIPIIVIGVMGGIIIGLLTSMLI